MVPCYLYARIDNIYSLPKYSTVGVGTVGLKIFIKFSIYLVTLFNETPLYNVFIECFIFRYYVRNSRHELRNATNVDNSCKWAGGGFVSNVQDLLKFGNAMLYSFQFNDAKSGNKVV